MKAKISPALFSVRMRATGPEGLHISGAEGIFKASEIDAATLGYTARALEHQRGKPEKIHISIEELKDAPRSLRALDVCTIRSGSMVESDEAVREILTKLGVTGRALNSATKVLNAKKPMRGAAIVNAITGKRLEPDRLRGVRARLLGMKKRARGSLLKKLDKYGIANDTVMEALTLATKAASAPYVVAELCASDDPHYTTGYIASKGLGYLRIPHIKEAGSMSGGRVVFVEKDADIKEVLLWLESVPVMVDRSGSVTGEILFRNIIEMG